MSISKLGLRALTKGVTTVALRALVVVILVAWYISGATRVQAQCQLPVWIDCGSGDVCACLLN
jgi:hypothetical protein